jgi:hypothetical protein
MRFSGEIVALNAGIDILRVINGYDAPSVPVVERSDSGIVTVTSNRRARAYFKEEGCEPWSTIIGPDRWSKQFFRSLTGAEVPPPRVVKFRAGDPNKTSVWFEDATDILPSPKRHHQNI